MPKTILPSDIHPRDRYKIMIGAIVPRPIAFVSTISQSGAHNLAPYSFFNGVGSNPMVLTFCPASDEHGNDKDSLHNCLPESEGGTGCFVVNLAITSYAHLVSAAAEPLAHGESEFDFTGLTPVASAAVAAPRVKESPLCFECKTLQVVRTNPGAPAGGNIVIGEVVAIGVHDESLMNERFHVDAERLDAIGRMGGLTYSTTRERFDMQRGNSALEQGPPAL